MVISYSFATPGLHSPDTSEVSDGPQEKWVQDRQRVVSFTFLVRHFLASRRRTSMVRSFFVVVAGFQAGKWVRFWALPEPCVLRPQMGRAQSLHFCQAELLAWKSASRVTLNPGHREGTQCLPSEPSFLEHVASQSSALSRPGVDKGMEVPRGHNCCTHPTAAA